MKRLLKLLLASTLVLPVVTGFVAVLAKFGDPWGMGSSDPLGVFITAALPILPPGAYQFLAWPLAYGLALLLSPLALRPRRRDYLDATLACLGLACAGWTIAWALAPDWLNARFGHPSVIPGSLNSPLRKFGVILLTDAAFLAATVSWWYWRESSAAKTPQSPKKDP